jgi:hypothetical protein
MNNDQSDRLDMFKAVIRFNTDTAVITATRPAFGVGIADLQTVVTGIEQAAGLQSTATSGAFTDKNVLQETLCQALFVVTSGTKAYAASVSNNTLEEEMNYSITDLRRIGDETIVPFTDNIVLLVTPHLAALAPFGITPLVMTALSTAKTNYKNFISIPRMAVTAKAAQTEALPPLFTQGTNICRKILDPIAVTLKAANPDWYNQYQNVRKIINTAQGTTSLEGIVTRQSDGTPLYNVEVKVNELNLIIHTDVNGFYRFAPIKRGTYTITFTLSGYETVTLGAFEIKMGHNITKNISLR